MVDRVDRVYRYKPTYSELRTRAYELMNKRRNKLNLTPTQHHKYMLKWRRTFKQ